MTAKIFSKDLRLAAHPMMYVFALFGVMLIIPNYPYTVVFFYGLLGIFFTFLNGRENKDVYYCAVLPVTKRDQVRARAHIPGITIGDLDAMRDAVTDKTKVVFIRAHQSQWHEPRRHRRKRRALRLRAADLRRVQRCVPARVL